MWQYLERKEEGELLHKVAEKGVINVARYYYHKNIYIGGQDDDVFNIYNRLNITKVINYKPEGLIMPLKLTRIQSSIKKHQSFSGKRSSSCSALLPPSKRPCLTSLTKYFIRQNRVH